MGGAKVNGVAFPISNSAFPSLVLRKASEFCVLTWYPAALPQWLVSSGRWFCVGGGGILGVRFADSFVSSLLVSLRSLVLGGGGGRPRRVPDLSGRVSGFPPLSVMSAVEILDPVEETPLHPCFAGILDHERAWDFVTCFLCTCRRACA